MDKLSYRTVLDSFWWDTSLADQFYSAYQKWDQSTMQSLTKNYKAKNNTSVINNSNNSNNSNNNYTQSQNNTSTVSWYKEVPVNSSYTWNSVVDYLNSIWWTSDMNSRKKYAQLYWIENYKWTAAQNTELLKKLKSWQIPTTATWTSMWWSMWDDRTMTADNWTVYWDGSIPTDMWTGTNYGTNLNEPISYSWLWDYSTNDPDRIQQMKNNIIQWYVKTNPELFYDRQRFNDFFHYDQRTSQAQRNMLDEVWNLYSKSNANPFDTTVLEQEKQFEQDKRDQIIWVIKNEVDQLNAKWNDIEWIANKNLKDARDRLDNISNEYMANVKKIQDLYDDYYWKSQQALQEKMAWEMAGLTSEMSAKKMSWLLRNSLYWIQQNYNKLFSWLAKEQWWLLQELNTAYWDFMLQLENHRDNLDNNEYSMLTDWYNNLKDRLNALAEVQQQSIEAINRAYENWYKAKTDAVVDEAGTAAKKEAKIAAYKQMNYTSRVKYIMDNLVTVLWEWADLSNVNYDDVRYAAENFSDPTQALLYIKDKVVSSGWKAGKTYSSTNGSNNSSSSSIWDWVDGSSIKSVWDALT